MAVCSRAMGCAAVSSGAAFCSGGNCSNPGAEMAMRAGSMPTNCETVARATSVACSAWIHCVRAAANSASTRERSAPGRSSASVQHLPVGLDPLLGVLQSSWAEAALASSPDLLGSDELDFLKDPYVLL